MCNWCKHSTHHNCKPNFNQKGKKETKKLLLWDLILCTVTETDNVWKKPVNYLQHCTMHILVAFMNRIPKSQPKPESQIPTVLNLWNWLKNEQLWASQHPCSVPTIGVLQKPSTKPGLDAKPSAQNLRSLIKTFRFKTFAPCNLDLQNLPLRFQTKPSASQLCNQGPA